MWCPITKGPLNKGRLQIRTHPMDKNGLTSTVHVSMVSYGGNVGSRCQSVMITTTTDKVVVIPSIIPFLFPLLYPIHLSHSFNSRGMIANAIIIHFIAVSLDMDLYFIYLCYSIVFKMVGIIAIIES